MNKKLLFFVCILALVVNALQAESAEIFTDSKASPMELLHEGYKQKNEGNFAQADKYFKNAAEQSLNTHVKAQAEAALGDLYLKGGSGLPKDSYRAFDHFEKAEKIGTLTKYEKNVLYKKMAKMHENGWGTPKNSTRAREYHQKAENALK